MISFKVDGIKKLDKKLKQIGSPPQKIVTKAARQGMSIALKATKKGGWIDQSGEMRKGMKLIGEKSKFKAKKVYQVVFDRAKNDIFQKRDKKGKINGYYPASMEYGFFAKNGRYIPGFHFMSKSIEENAITIKAKIVSTMSKEIDKIMKA